MTATTGPAPATAMDTTTRARARVAGIFYLITFVTSIPALALEHPALTHINFIVTTASGSRLLLGGLLDLLNALAAVGTAVALYPLLRQRHPSLALGFVASRLMEAAAILTSVAVILTLVTLHTSAPGATGIQKASLITIGRSLVALHDATFLLGPGLIPAINALLLGTVMYRTGLVPRVIPTIGLIGAPVLLASATATFFGVYEQVSTPAALASLPVAIWELSLGLWMSINGVRSNVSSPDRI